MRGTAAAAFQPPEAVRADFSIGVDRRAALEISGTKRSVAVRTNMPFASNNVIIIVLKDEVVVFNQNHGKYYWRKMWLRYLETNPQNRGRDECFFEKNEI